MASERNNTLTTLMILDDTNNTNDIKIPENEKNKGKCVCIETHCLPQVFNGVFLDTSSHCEHRIVYLTNLPLVVVWLNSNIHI